MKNSFRWKKYLNVVIVILLTVNLQAQTPLFSRQDTLRGSITPERSWWDLVYYHLDIVVNPSDSTIRGTNTITYRVIKPYEIMQIDLQEPLALKSASINNKELKYTREGNVYWIEIGEKQVPGKIYSVVLTMVTSLKFQPDRPGLEE